MLRGDRAQGHDQHLQTCTGDEEGMEEERKAPDRRRGGGTHELEAGMEEGEGGYAHFPH